MSHHENKDTDPQEIRGRATEDDDTEGHRRPIRSDDDGSMDPDDVARRGFPATDDPSMSPDGARKR